ncbi:hypothetical protein ECG_03316 [Echinococcus granulosus]|nr:hypothetical protein ECG_03316 [Echinococcus granulosus]
MKDFPGYFYDPSQGNYFKIPNYWDVSCIPTSPSNQQSDVRLRQRALDKLKTALNKQQSQSIVQDFESIAISKRCLRLDFFMKMHFRLLCHKQQLGFNYPIIRQTVVETDSASILHMISDQSLFCELRRYEVKWTQSQNSSDESGFKIIDTTSRSQHLDHYGCLDATLDHSTKDILCLSPRRLTFVRYDSEVRDYQLLRTIKLARKYTDSVFSRGALRSYISSMDTQLQCEEDSVVMFHNHRIISAFGSKLVPLLSLSELLKMPRVSLSKFSQPIFTAVGSAAYLQNMRKLDAYVAVGKAFSLLSFTSAKSELELIRFGGADASDIAHLQCLLSPNNERSGVIVGRVDGSVELWEDRQPKSAAVIYKESKGAVERGLPPRPVVDYPSHSFVATAMEKCGAIGIWQLQTGELVNILECPAWVGNKLLFCRPPQLVMRSYWGLEDGKSSSCGPVLIAIHDKLVDFFY